MALIEDIESYGLEKHVSISSAVRSFKRSGSLVMTSVDTNIIGMSGSLILRSVDATNGDSGNMSLNIGSIVSSVIGAMCI